VWAGAVACGGSGDDDDGQTAATAGEDGSGGTDSGSGGTDTGTGGSEASAGAGDSGATGGTSSSAGTSSTGGGAPDAGRGGSTGRAGSTSVSGNTEELLDQIGEVCETDCDAQYATECAPTNTNTLTCQLSCAAATAQLGDFCLEEYRDYIDCRGDGGYDCVNDYPYQRSTCAAEQVAYSECAQHIGCKRYCKKAIDEGCIESELDACIDECLTQDQDLPEDCQRYYSEQIAYCQATNPTTCIEGGLSTPAACSYAVLTIAECISDESQDLCDGWCWAANRLGCGGEDCASECAEKSEDETCGAAWKELLDCGLFFGDAACDSASFNANGICDSEVQAYTTCIEGDTTG
jgi:hypothetical protein